MAAPGDVAYFGAMLERLFRRVPFSVTSWWRTPRRNTEVGGHPVSRHLDGLAVDVQVDPGHNPTALLVEAKTLGLHGIDEGDHIHLQLYAPGQDRAGAVV